MILYFADRRMNILGIASTELPEGFAIVEDTKTEDVETGVAVLECTLAFDVKSRETAEKCTEVGNYLLCSYHGENSFFTIIENESDTKSREISVYAEDAGLDLLNEICVAYEADRDYPIAHYIEKFAYDSGFVIGVNEASGLSRKLSWDGESTAAERIASVATQFDNCEVSYSFEIKGLQVIKKYINIYKKRGAETGVQLRLNKEIDKIVSKKSIANLATALKVTGGTPEEEENPIDLNGYSYDDGDIFLEGTYLKSRSAVAIWSRYLAETGNYTGHIMRTYTYDTTSQSELCNRAVSELKKVSQIEVNYEADVSELPDSVRVGDRVSIVDEAGKLYLSTRILKLEESATGQTRKVTFGEFLMKDGGIHEDVERLATRFSESSHSAAHALTVAKEAKTQAIDAQDKASGAVVEAEKANQAAEEAKTAADNAGNRAAEAQVKADSAVDAVNKVKEDVVSIEKTVEDANSAANRAKEAAATAETKANEAQEASAEAKKQASAAEESALTAKNQSATAITKSEEAQTVADSAKLEAAEAKTTAAAAKLDAEQAEKDVAAFGESLDSLSNTMQADYARKSDLTETETKLQTQISQNAAEIQSTATQVTKIDETANNAAEKASKAQTTAEAAQAKADQSALDAAAAQQTADDAALAASNAQNEADKAKTAAANAQSVADKAEDDLAAAIADLATVQGRVDATEEDIAAAQQAVETAQAAADKAKVDAQSAADKATAAQNTADSAVTDAANAQTAADNAASAAVLAQKTADAAKGDATAAQKTANEAAAAASAAQKTADTAKTNAANAQAKADTAATAAANAQQAADDAEAKAQSAATDLATAEKNLADVTSRVDATEGEISAAKEAVIIAQARAEEANNAAVNAQKAADIAKENAETAQNTADEAQEAADSAQSAATAAKKAADEAQDDVDALAVRVTTAETKISQTAEQIKLLATKEEVSETLGGYYTKEEADAAIELSADNVKIAVSNTYATKTALSLTDTKAENAATAAGKAQDDVDALAIRVTDTETAVEQNAADITLRATKKELNTVSTAVANAQSAADTAQETADAIGIELDVNYYTKTETDAKIKIEADKISAVVETVDSQETKISTLEQTSEGFTARLDLVEAAADDAAKTATNYLSYDSTTGLQIGNKRNGTWSGYRTRVSSSSFDILDSSGNEVASYGGSTVEMCGGEFIISHSSSLDYTSITSGNLHFGADTIWLDCPVNSTNNYVRLEEGKLEIALYDGSNDTYGANITITDGVAIDGKVSAASSGVLWINGRDGAAFKSTVQPGSTGSYLPLTSVKSYNGSWETGILGDVLYFVYGTDANYNAGTNTVMNSVYIYPNGTLYCNNANVNGLGLVAYAGETLTCNTCACSGFVTNDANTIYFQVPLPKILNTAHNNLTVTTFKANIRKSTGGYIGAATSAVSGGYNYLSNSNYTVGISSYNPLSVEMFVRNDTTKFDATNNSPVALECYIQFKVN